jgi:hypothetical protein
MMLLTETRERFLLAIAGQVPVERIAEIHFFQPIRQGGVESGVAVVAAWPEPATHDPASEEAGQYEQREVRRGGRAAHYRRRRRARCSAPLGRRRRRDTYGG